MRFRLAVLSVIGLLAFAPPAGAQTPTGTVSGHIVSPDGEALPGVSVSVASPALQGVRTVVSSVNGDYVVPLLPPGAYTITFELSGFETLKEARNVAGMQTVSLNAKMSLSAVTAEVSVVAKAEPFVQTAQVAANFEQDLMATLPTNRTMDATVLMAPSVHATGPRGAVSLSGAQSYESLFAVNGVVTTENLRGSPFTLYIEDALQEMTVSVSGVSAEYGRFGGGVVNAVTKSGGNIFSGSFRTTFYNDGWRAYTPYESTQRIANPTLDTRLHKTVPTYEMTFGGPVMRDRLWFFGAARVQKQESNRQTVGTLVSYVRTNDDKRYEGKATYAPHPNHSLQASYIKVDNVLRNNTSFNVMDLASLTDQGQPMDLLSLHYGGVVRPNFFLEAQYSNRHLKFTNVGATTKDLIAGTGVTDQARGGWRYWSPTFCAGSTCDGDEQRNNDDFIVKGSYFASSKGSGSHHLVFGYDRYNDRILANTHANGSDYRILGTTSIMQGTTIFPQFLSNNTTTISWSPLTVLSRGSNLVTHSLFVSDAWRLSGNLSFTLGLRLDKNEGKDGGGQNVADRASLSPRISAVWDPSGDGRWAVSGSYSRYVAAITSNVAASTAAAGNAATYRWFYQGPAINADPNGPLVTTAVALRQLFDWFFANGGTDRRPLSAVNIPGTNVKIRKPLKSPYANEYAGGVSRQFGNRGTVRVDAMFREYRDLYSQRIDSSTGQVTDALGNRFDLIVYENTNDLKRRYAGVTTQATYRIGRFDLGGNYTLSHAYGSFDGENANSGPTTATVNAYPEYLNRSWSAPEGDLSIDQRHRVRFWGTYTAPIPQRAGSLSVGLLQQAASGVPYGGVGTVNSSPYVTNPGYVTPPTAVTYYYTARDAFRTEPTYRTDLSLNYSYRLPGSGASRPELFFQGQVVNLFNEFQLCGCGASVFNSGGITDLSTIGQALRTPTNTSAMQAFNPFTTTPVQGTNWDYNTSSFGKPQSAFAFTSPRTFRFSVGVRF